MRLGHIGIPVKDIATSKVFYDAIAPYVDLENIDRGEVDNVRYGENGSTRFYLHRRSESISEIHICFNVQTREAVDAFHKFGISFGGTDHGAPGVREEYGPTYYAAFVLDPDGNNIEAVCR